MTYKQAGVDIDAGNNFIKQIAPLIERTKQDEMIGGLGGFGGLFELPSGYKKPVLVSGADGVGTKLKLAIEYNEHYCAGIDLVAMCVNDVVTTGADPMFFLDYYASSKLEPAVGSEIIRGIADGCTRAGCTLIGGETAEMPGMYQPGDYDLAGFCVGIVEKDQIIGANKENIREGDSIIALPSSGPHANGFSLIREIINISEDNLHEGLTKNNTDTSIVSKLLAPTSIYVSPILSLIKQFPGQIKGIAHITGGGLMENIPRALPPNLCADIDQSTWGLPPIFEWLRETGNLSFEEMYRVFNCGVGMVFIVSPEAGDNIIKTVPYEFLWKIGDITEKGTESIRFF